MIVYVDASALVPLIKIEDASALLRDYLGDLIDDGHLLVAGQLLETEMLRAANRQGISPSAVEAVLENVHLIEHEASDFSVAARFPMTELGSLDALHLAAAQRARVSAMITLDTQLSSASQAVGIPVLDVTRPRTLH